MAYDSADPGRHHRPPHGAGQEEEEEVELRMIDFAYPIPFDGENGSGHGGEGGPPGDEGYLYGVNNVSLPA